MMSARRPGTVCEQREELREKAGLEQPGVKWRPDREQRRRWRTLGGIATKGERQKAGRVKPRVIHCWACYRHQSAVETYICSVPDVKGGGLA